MENNEEKIETKNENQIKEQNEAKELDVQTNLENKIIKEDEIKNENEIKNETKEENISKDNENKDDNEKKETDIKESKDKETNDDAIDPHLIFQKELLRIIKKQQQILNSTSTINEKFGISNEITKEQIASFKINIDKYGKYLIMIKKELGMISDTMKKIKKLSKEDKKDSTEQN